MIYRLVDTNLLDWLDGQTVKSGLIHQANCFRTMGAGIALQIANRYPEAYEADKKTPNGAIEKLGTFSYATVNGKNDKFVFNLYSQHRFGGNQRNTSYDALLDGLEKIFEFSCRNEIERLGIPHGMGCMLGGGEWEIVNKLIEVVCRGNLSGPDLYICRYEPSPR